VRKRRVVVTGVGVVTSVGAGRSEFWEAVCRGRSGAKEVPGVDLDDGWRTDRACLIGPACPTLRYVSSGSAPARPSRGRAWI